MAPAMKVLLTGGTGFLGEYLLAELLERGHTVWAMYRSEPRKLDSIRFLSSLGLPHSADSLRWFKGDVLQTDSKWNDWCRQHEGLEEVDTLLHSAASTKLRWDESSGEPVKTNLGGAEAIRRLVDRKPMQVHLISTAYVCGFIRGRTVYEVNHPRGDFINVYEESKWEAEQIWLGNATVLRPSIIVGDSETGRSTTFAGLYILFQATDLLARLVSEVPGADRHNLRLDIPADPNGTANIIPVNYVAKAAIRIIEDPANYNQIFHLTHPNPPLHRLTMDVVCRRFDIGGINFVGEDSRFSEPRNRIERMVFKQMEAIRVYFSTNPIFDRTNTDSALADLEVPAITESFLDKILDYAIEKNWGHLPQ